MAYKTANSVKHERKQGMDAMRQMVGAPGFDAQAALALAQLNEDAFKKIDDLDNAAFVRYMEDMRKNHPDIYPVFWWWRDAEEKAGRRQETDSDQPETRYRTFMITQFLRAPFSDDWEDDRRHLKPGIEPWITEEQIEKGLDHTTIKRWAWIWHDRDIYTEQDEIADRDGKIKAGELKFKHVHIMLDILSKFPISTIARWFNVPPQQVTVLRGRGAFLDGVEYLPHESPRAIEQFKTHYDDDEIHASPGFDFRKELIDLQAHRAGEMTPADTMRMHVMQEGWTMRMCRDDDPLTYAKIRSSLPPLRLDYLLDAEPCPYRMNIYVDGPGGIGKSSFCEYIAQAMFPGADDPYFTIGNDERVTFDGYDGQPAIIWDDVRVTDFIRQFGSNGAFRILDPHPKKIAQRAKHSRVILTNAVNIINGVQPYQTFIDGLAGTYTDKFGTKHEAEDENQAWRRFPLILCVRADDFTVLINKGIVDNDLSSVKAMYMYAQVRGSLKAMMEKLEGTAKDKALVTFGTPVQSAVKMLQDSHDKKISDPDQIPPELMPRVTYLAGSVEEAKCHSNTILQDELERKIAENKTEFENARVLSLIKFGYWFWSSVSGGLAWYLERHPNEFENPDAADALAEDDDMLREAYAGCVAHFHYSPGFVLKEYQIRNGKVVMAYSRIVYGSELIRWNSLYDALPFIKNAWDGCFEPTPTPLPEDPAYDDWKRQVYYWKQENRHKICPICRKSFPPDMLRCGYCGRELPEMHFFEEIEFDMARYQLAIEQECEPMEVSYDDVRARLHQINTYAEY